MDLLYFDYKSGDDITLNLNIPDLFLWYTVVDGPVTFKFSSGLLNVIYKNFLLRFTHDGVTIFSDFDARTFRRLPPKSLVSLTLSEEQAETIWRGIQKLTKGKREFTFDPSTLRMQDSLCQSH